MSLIDETYFNGDVFIPQLGQLSVQEVVSDLIAKHEPLFLEAVLGYELYKDFVQGISINNPLQKWIDIRDGCEFTTGGMKLSWKGFVQSKANKLSIIANYVYYQWQINHHTNTTAVGEVKSSAENGVRVLPSNKMVRSWNMMVDELLILWLLLSIRQSDYPSFKIYAINGKMTVKQNTFGI